MSENPTPAQQAAARGAYEDVQASTGGESKLTPPATADPVQDVADATPPAGDDSAASAVPTEESTETREAMISDPPTSASATGAPSADVGAPGPNASADPVAASGAGSSSPVGDEAAALAAERLLDLQRLQAEYVNYKRRVDRDRALESERAIGGVVEALLPVMDEIHLARQHGELEGGPFAKIAEKFESILARYGVQRYGEPGETFDPNVHEAVMHTHAELAPGTTDTTVVQIMQPGYRLGERVLRPALVAVADPA